MSLYVSTTYEGHCPQIRETRTIGIRLAEVSFIGQSTAEYKKMLYSCPDAEVCQYLDQYGRCPLYIEAPNHL